MITGMLIGATIFLAGFMLGVLAMLVIAATRFKDDEDG